MSTPLCASGALLYTQARENKAIGPEASLDRASLAIALAEHVISPSNVNAPSSNGAFAPDASNVRAKKSSRLYHYPD
ncbi:hypothetical protein PGT21_020589 [Puccinia graminis f. sp. tritici]|uniref:Uncharacterized protein n=1 Tax=Puccinia graminis f. sp. tritici TaxID=56615 RepID=A0A5B0P9Q0_PUCGR|nr:hypothetical protein PGT21_020589 [Puccinia graminis f. sp. tritici]